MAFSPMSPVLLPPQICGAATGSWAEKTMFQRLPDLVTDLLQDKRFSQATLDNLQALRAEIPHGQIRHLTDSHAPDHASWQAQITQYEAENWLTANWFFAECYFYRRVLEATGFYLAGPGEKLDPYEQQKAQGLKQAYNRLPPLAALLNDNSQSCTFKQSTLRYWLSNALWGNQADLSLWLADAADQPANQDIDRDAQLMADDSNMLAPIFASLPLERLDIVLDNAGIELTGDLLLADYLFRCAAVDRIVLHAKAHPTFVSDATIKDVLQTIRYLSKHSDADVVAVGERLANYVALGQLQVESHFYWNSAKWFWQLDPDLAGQLATSQLIISKGDANYRRILGDYQWSDLRPFTAIGSYLPAPLLALRTLKSEMITGLAAERIAAVATVDPRWRINGRWGVMQLAFPN